MAEGISDVDADDNWLAGSSLGLREFAIAFARLIAALAVDPHGYFEKKYVARLDAARSEQEINGVLTQLVQWAASAAVTDAQRERLDSELHRLGLAGFAELRLRYLR